MTNVSQGDLNTSSPGRQANVTERQSPNVGSLWDDENWTSCDKWKDLWKQRWRKTATDDSSQPFIVGEKLSTYEQIQMRGVEHSNRQSLSARHVMIMMKNSPNVSRDTLGRHIQRYMTIVQRTVLTVWKLYKECPSQPPPKLPSPSTSSWSLSISTSLSPLISSHSILKYKINTNKTTVTCLYFIAVRN